MGSYLGPVPATSGPFFSDVHGGQITVIDITEEYLKGARITSIVEDYGISKYAPVIATLLKNPMLILPQ